MAQGFDQRLVGLQQLHVLADHGNGDFLVGIELAGHHAIPLGQIGGRALHAEALDDKIIQALGMQHGRNAVDGIDVFQADNRALFHVGEERNLASGRKVDRMVGTADQHIGLQADGA